jgi:hypothetical protein
MSKSESKRLLLSHREHDLAKGATREEDDPDEGPRDPRIGPLVRILDQDSRSPKRFPRRITDGGSAVARPSSREYRSTAARLVKQKPRSAAAKAAREAEAGGWPAAAAC